MGPKYKVRNRKHNILLCNSGYIKEWFHTYILILYYNPNPNLLYNHQPWNN